MTPEEVKLHAIEVDYRGGLMSKRAVARKHGIALSTLQDMAKRHEWDRDPALASRAMAEGQAQAIEAHSGEVLLPSRPGRPPAPVIEQLPAEIVVDLQRGQIAEVLTAQAASGAKLRRLGDKLADRAERQVDKLAEIDAAQPAGRQGVVADTVATKKIAETGKEAGEIINRGAEIERKALGLPDKNISAAEAKAAAQSNVTVNLGGPNNADGIPAANWVSSDGKHLCEQCCRSYLTREEKEEWGELAERMAQDDLMTLIEEKQELDDRRTAREELEWMRKRVAINPRYD